MVLRHARAVSVLDLATPAAASQAVDKENERAWVAGIRDGDGRAFRQLFLNYFDSLCAFAYGYVQSREVAEEVVQDVLCGIWERRASWVVRESLAHFLYGAVRNRSLNHLAHARVVTRTEAQAMNEAWPIGMGRGPAPADEQVRMHEVAAAFEAALIRLPERTRLAVLLRLRNGLSMAEVAQAMGITIKGVEFHVARGLHVLRQELAAFF